MTVSVELRLLSLVLRRTATRIVGERNMSRIARAFHYVVRERNPLLQAVYVVVVVGAFILFMFYVWPYWSLFERDRAVNGGRSNKVQCR